MTAAPGRRRGVGDYDNGKDQDLYLANEREPVYAQNSNNGTFTEVGSSAGVNDAEAGWA